MIMQVLLRDDKIQLTQVTKESESRSQGDRGQHASKDVTHEINDEDDLSRICQAECLALVHQAR